MNFDLSRQSPFATILFLVLLIFVFWTSGLGITPIEIPAFTPFEQWIDGLIVKNQVIAELISALLVFLVALVVARLTIRSVIFMERSYLPALIYLVISAGYYSSLYTLRPIIAALMIAHATKWVLRSYSRKSLASGDYVVAGFWLSMATIFFSPAAVAMPMLFIGLTMFRFWDIREWIAAIGGLIFPLLTSLIIYYLIGINLNELLVNIGAKLHYTEPIMEPLRRITVLHWTFIGITFVLFMLAVTNFFMRRKKFSTKPYLSYLYFIWFAIISVVTSVLLPVRTIYLLPIVALPLAVLLPSYFNGRRPTFLSNFIYAMFIVTAVAISMLQLILASLR